MILTTLLHEEFLSCDFSHIIISYNCTKVDSKLNSVLETHYNKHRIAQSQRKGTNSPIYKITACPNRKQFGDSKFTNKKFSKE